MTTAAILKEQATENPYLYETDEEAKARRNAEYLAKLERGVRELEEGKGITMTFEEWERLSESAHNLL